MYNKKHIIIHSSEKHSGKCSEACKELDVLHFHIKKNAKDSKKDALMFFPKDGQDIQAVMDLHKSYYSNSDITVSNGINSFQFVPKYDTSDYSYYRGQGIDSIVNDARTHHFETLDGNRFLHNIDRNTLFGPITDITTEATDLLFQKSELSKGMSTINFKQHPEVDSRPDQNVQPTNMLSNVTRRKGGQTMLGQKVALANQSMRAANKEKPLTQKTYQSQGKKKAGNMVNTPDSGSFYSTGNKQFAIANPTANDASIHHEANHMLTDKLVGKFGVDQVNSLYDKFIGHISPNAMEAVNSGLKTYGYEAPSEDAHPRNQLQHKEEIVNMLRDLTQKGSRRTAAKTAPRVSASTGNPVTDDNNKQIMHTFNPKATERSDKVGNKGFMGLDNELKSSWRNIVNHAKQHKFTKSEDLNKGSFQSRNKFNPKQDIPEQHRKDIGSWQVQEDESARDRIPRLEGNGRNRALNKLAAKTDVKMKDGKRHFLLFRGMNSDEKDKFIGNGKTNYPKGHLNSWTPKEDVADSFNDGYDTPTAAWVHEDDIHHIPSTVGWVVPNGSDKKDRKTVNPYNYEHEVLVNHSKPHSLMSDEYEHNKQNNVNAIINNRFNKDLDNKSRFPGNKLVEGDSKIKRRMSVKNKIQEPRLMAASEKMETNIKKAGGIKNAIVAGSLALGFASAGNHVSQEQPKPVEQSVSRRPALAQSADGQFKNDNNADSLKREEANQKRDSFLHAISMNESSGGVNTNYPPGGGMHGSDKAFSDYGMMPITARESINRHPELKSKYGHLLSIKDNNTLGQLLTKHKAGHDIAEHRYDYLNKKFNGSVNDMAHAWRRGVKGTYDAIKAGKDISSTDYVKKFNKNYLNSL